MEDIEEIMKKIEQTSDYQHDLKLLTSIAVVYEILKENNFTNDEDWSRRYQETEKALRQIAIEKVKENIEQDEEYEELIKDFGKSLMGE